MKTIETIEEIRKIRTKISQKCDFNPKKLIDYYLKRQKKRKKAQQTDASDSRASR
jgi:hypothetical protein